jgi:N-acetylgalactosamine-N,N'-diacetylbacillosaminyl-diphospho-undecaprenol 4-alpha-N-acetylgalactosaminyltransferase
MIVFIRFFLILKVSKKTKKTAGVIIKIKMKKKKVCILAISLDTGGAERVISLLTKFLIKDYEVTLILLSNNIEYQVPNNIDIICLGERNSLSNKSLFSILKSIAKFIRQYRTLAKQKKFDVIMSFLALPNIINTMVSSRLKHQPKIIISERCYPSKMYENNGFAMKIAKTFYPMYYNKADVLFSNSIHINLDLKENFGIKIPMEVIYNPIDVNENKRINLRDLVFNKSLNIINSGTVYNTKNQTLILKAMALSSPGEFKLTILGDGELMEDLRLKSKKLNIEGFLILEGKVRDVKSHLLRNDCFVLSSNTEGFPNALLEALSVGLPSISTNCMSGPLEMLNDNEHISIGAGDFFKAKYGILINVNDKVALHKALIYLKRNPDERKRYSNLAFERAKYYSMSKIYGQVKNLINN